MHACRICWILLPMALKITLLTMTALDRGYSSIDNVNRCAMVGQRHTGTVTCKCNAGPFTNKQPSSLNGRPMNI